jgi:hypothetical protein
VSISVTTTPFSFIRMKILDHVTIILHENIFILSLLSLVLGMEDFHSISLTRNFFFILRRDHLYS